MIGPSYVSEPTVYYLSQLLDELARGSMQLPRLPRGAADEKALKLQLLQNVRDGLPIGTFLLWRTDQTRLTMTRTIGSHALSEPTASGGVQRNYLLDGAHRLSSFFSCLRPSEETERGERLGYDLLEEEFAFLEPEETPEPTWMPLPLLLDSLSLLRFQRALGDRPDREHLSQRSDALAETFRLYKIPVVPLLTEDISAATRAYAQVHHMETKGAEQQMLYALTWREGFDLLDRLSQVRDPLAELGWESLEPEWILEVCKAAADLEPIKEAPAALADLLEADPDALTKAVEHLRWAATWLAERCGVSSPRALPHPMQAVMLAEAHRICPAPDETTTTRLLWWFWHTTYAELLLDPQGLLTAHVLEDLREIARGKPYLPSVKRGRRFALPTGFQPGSMRVKAMALRLAAQGPLELDGQPIDAAKQLASSGANALVPVVPELRDAAGRMFVQPGGKLHKALLGDATRISPEILESHVILAEAANALSRKDWVAFMELRGKAIRALEEAFYASVARNE